MRSYAHETRVRPTTRQSNRGATHTAIRPRNCHFNIRERRIESTQELCNTETLRVVVSCALFVATSILLLQGFGWCVGHFLKGWW